MQFPTLKEWFEDSFARHAEKTAITFLRRTAAETEISYGNLAQDINRCANRFLELGIQKGDRVVLFLEKSLFFITAHFALLKIGAISVPLNPGFKESEMTYLLNDAEPTLVLSEADRADMVARIVSDNRIVSINSRRRYRDQDFFRASSSADVRIGVGPQDAGLIIYTSGTTGNPKGAVLTHKNLANDARNVIEVWEISDSDVLCHALPLFHVHGLCFALHTALLAGSGVVLLDRFAPQEVLEVLARRNGSEVCTLFMAVPAMYTKMLDTLEGASPDFGHVRLWTSGSAPLLVREFERIHHVFGKQPVEREGMSETGMNFSNPLRGLRKPGSIGIPLPGVDVRIVDPDTFVDVAPGRVGELWLQSDSITPGYWRKPQETADTFVDGWFRTGDLGRVDADGYYYLTDRIKHIIISGGENVSAKEVETVINLVDGVKESTVVGLPDEKWGEMVAAAVIPKTGAAVTEADIRTYCKQQLHDWKCPKKIRFVEDIPKNTMGKVLKEDVKTLLLE